jgi:putative transposase
MIAYKFRMYPSKEQEERLDFALEICRQTYNNLLSDLQGQTEINRNKIQHKIVKLKKENPEITQVYSKTLQYECYRLFSNLSALSHLKRNGKRVGRMRFKGKGWFKTINYNQSGFKLITTEKRFSFLELSKIGKIKIIKHREIIGKIKQIAIKKSCNKWYAIIITDFTRIIQNGNKILGIDLGINHFIADSEGNFVAHPKNIERFSLRLKKAQRKLSKKKKGSHNRWKARVKVMKIHEKIENCRNDFLHKITTQLIKNCKIIIVEDLKIKEMMMNCYNAKNMADASWGKFLQMLEQKVESTTAKVVRINPKNTTKTCSKCGNIQDMPIWKRTYSCKCGLEMDRDINSAINIKNKFISQELAIVENKSSTDCKDNQQDLSMKQEALPFRVV